MSVKRDGKWVNWTWQQFYNDVIKCAKSISTFGVTPSDGINIIGFNSPGIKKTFPSIANFYQSGSSLILVSCVSNIT